MLRVCKALATREPAFFSSTSTWLKFRTATSTAVLIPSLHALPGKRLHTTGCSFSRQRGGISGVDLNMHRKRMCGKI